MADQTDKNRRTIFILSIPGGAMLGINPSMVLARLEQLTETSATDSFQVLDGVSTGSIPIAALNIRDPDNPLKARYDATQEVDLYCQHGPWFFPQIPNRMHKLSVAGFMSNIEDRIDPLQIEKLLVEDIKKVIAKLQRKIDYEDSGQVVALRELATKRWISKADKREALTICEQLAKKNPRLAPMAENIGELVFQRHSTREFKDIFHKSIRPDTGEICRWARDKLSAVFSSAAMAGIHRVRKWTSDAMFDPKRPKQIFQELYGDTRMSDCMRTTYITSYDANNHRNWTFFCRKKDFFDLSPDNPSETSRNNSKLWDAVMASIANFFAFPPHTTEDGTLFSDKGILHTPLTAVYDVNKHKPADADIKLVILGTGRYLTPNRETNLLRDEYDHYGNATGNFMRGNEIAELQSCNFTRDLILIRDMIGKGNIIDITPRLSARNNAEADKMPSKNSLDASDENMKRIINRAFSFIEEEDERIRELALMLVENLHNIGQMDDDKYRRVTNKILNPPPGEREAFKNSFGEWTRKWLQPAPAPEQDNYPEIRKLTGGPGPR